MTITTRAATDLVPVRRSRLVWRQIIWPGLVDEQRVRGLLTALATLDGSPFVAFEVIGAAGQVAWRVGASLGVIRSVQALALAHVPGVRFDDPSHQDVGGLKDLSVHPQAHLASDVVATIGPATAARLQFTGTRLHPLRTDSHEDVTRTLLAVLAGTGSGEVLRVQAVCGARLRPRRYPQTEGERAPAREVVRSLEEAGFQVALRLSASAASEGRARQLVSQATAALRGLELPPVRLQVWRANLDAVAEARAPWLLPLHLRVSELPGLLAWPLADDLPGTTPIHPVLLPPPSAVRATRQTRGARALGASVTDPNQQVALSAEDSLRHLHLLGPTGVGKSTLMAHLALQDITAGRGVVVIDPKGDLVRDIVTRIPEDCLGEVAILDASDPAPVGINPLAGARDPDLAADILLGVCHSLYADSWGPRTHDILHASLLTLARRGDASLVMVPMLLTNPGFRRSVVGRVARADPMGLGAFWAWFDALSDGERQQVIAPLMNKLRPISLRPQLRAVFGQRQPRFTFTDIFGRPRTGDTPRPRVLLVNLAQGAIGAEAARLLGSIAVALVWQAAQERAALQAMGRRPVMVYIDEVQDYLRLPGDLGAALAQARGLGVGFTLAHQHLGQLPKHLLRGVMANARSRVAFALNRDDARAIANESQGVLAAEDYQRLPAFRAYATLLAGGELQPPCSLHTTPLDPPLRTHGQAHAWSRDQYGQTLDVVETDLLSLIDTPAGDPRDPAPIGRVRRHTGADGQPGIGGRS